MNIFRKLTRIMTSKKFYFEYGVVKSDSICVIYFAMIVDQVWETYSKQLMRLNSIIMEEINQSVKVDLVQEFQQEHELIQLRANTSYITKNIEIFVLSKQCDFVHDCYSSCSTKVAYQRYTVGTLTKNLLCNEINL